MGFIIGKLDLIRSLSLTIRCSKSLPDSGTVTIFQYGAGPNGVMRTLGKYMLGSGATFG